MAINSSRCPNSVQNIYKFKNPSFFVAQLNEELTTGSQRTTELTKHTLISDALDAVPQAYWKGSDQNVKVKEEGEPSCGLVL